MPALNPITSKTLAGKLGSMQMLLLTAMTLLGFYLCFKEIRRLAIEMASLRDQVNEEVVAATAAAVSAAAKRKPMDRAADSGEAPPKELPVGDGTEIEPAEMDEEDVLLMVHAGDDEGLLDEGLRQMLAQLQGGCGAAASLARAERPSTAEIEEIPEEPGDLSRETLATKTKAEIEDLLREHGVPFKKSDAKGKLIDALMEALDASGGDDNGEGEGEADGQGDAADQERKSLEAAVAARE